LFSENRTYPFVVGVVPFPFYILVVPILMICSYHRHHLFCNDGYGAKDLVVEQRSPWWIHDIDESCKFWDAQFKSCDNWRGLGILTMMEFKSMASKGQVYGNVTIKHMTFVSSLSCN
jgi:hypothetical protein